MVLSYLVERVWSDLRELVFHVVWIHGADLFATRRAQDLDDFDQLVNARLSGEEGLTEHQFGHDTAG